MITVLIGGTTTTSTLRMIDPNTGVDWVKDFIGNQGAFNDGQFTWDETLGAYVATQDTFDWWSKVIGDKIALDERIIEIKNLILDDEEVDRIVSEASECDLEDLAARVNAALNEAYGFHVGV